MKKIITFILLFTCSTANSQSWEWEWSHALKGTDGIFCQVVATDNLNQSYLMVTYEDTLVIGDTVFRHPYEFNHMQTAIGIYDQFGKFRKAMDFYCPVRYQAVPASVKPENNRSVLIGGTFSDEYLASDTTLYSVNSNTEVFIGKYDDQGKHRWLKTIRGPMQDDLIDYIPAGQGITYVIGQHRANLTPVWVNFFGADSVQHRQSLIYVLKLDSTGNIIWRRECISYGCSEVYQVGAVLGDDGNVYVQGSTRCHLIIVGQDTIRHSGGDDPENFIFAMDSQGVVVHQQMRSGNFSIVNMSADTEHNLFFSGFVRDTTIFANDTIIIQPEWFPCILGKIDWQNNLLWYHLFYPPYFGSTHWLDFSVASDTIWAAFTTDNGMFFGDTSYNFQGLRTMILQYSPDGTLRESHLLQGSSSNYSYRLIPDHCSDLVIGGLFSGKAYNGADTLQTSRDKEAYIGRIKRWTHSIDIGPDTLINYSASITLSAGVGYDTYRWSTGESASSIVVTGSALGPGPHKIGISAFNNGCESRDTITIIVKDNNGIADTDHYAGLFQIYPNPVINIAVIEYELPFEAQVQMRIYDFTGREIASVVDQKQEAGKHKITYNMTDLAPGIYYFQMIAGEEVQTKKVVFTVPNP